jgi:hypothetical protein
MQVSKCEFEHAIAQAARSESGVNGDGSCETLSYFNSAGEEIAVQVVYHQSGESAYFLPNGNGQ